MKRPVGTITRGTTNPNRLRRVDAWMAWRYHQLLRHSPAPVVVDLGYGQSPITTVELARQLSGLHEQLEVIGLEIDPTRVALAQTAASARISFARGGFEIPTPRDPLVIRAFNVLRQYPVGEVAAHWRTMQQRLAPEGRIVEGTCDEPGRLAAWVELSSDQPLTLTLAADPSRLEHVSDIAPRLPKVLIHHNIDPHPVHRFFVDADAAWASHSALRIFGARQRWAATVRSLRASWPVVTP
ncbi:MAG TPA: SAM-dependent methyltransferase, partial [Actinobacteria bacterium]|nr:SAM-dependent methyltransferase [Actinomycetota bacterium]